MLIPHTELAPETLDQLLSDYASRDGTDDGQFTTLDERKMHLLASLEREDVFITYNHKYQQPCLVAKHDVTAEALADFATFKEQKKSEAATELAYQAQCEQDFIALHSRYTSEGVFPLSLGRTVQSHAVNVLQQNGSISLADLQELLRRHSMGDYGVIGWGDKLANLKAISFKGMIYSRYAVAGHDICVETIDGHRRTMARLPSD
ncbi:MULTISPECIES: YheU family protein [Pseudomonas]|uniref:YheU family protein n=1 Tax=Pseudomonas TaxID=286 RepID=UPI00070BFD32|nr:MULTISPECIES: YheU family protein [Pseudomonas]KQW19993.1 hypothetical protein ASC85_09160 [Pseudomonas sp. Root401]WHS57591.1 YheU family protein [Pseudomonas brassicacearum]WNZ87329.1 YheU family protein [Pseudomonas sp. P108]